MDLIKHSLLYAVVYTAKKQKCEEGNCPLLTSVATKAFSGIQHPAGKRLQIKDTAKFPSPCPRFYLRNSLSRSGSLSPKNL